MLAALVLAALSGATPATAAPAAGAAAAVAQPADAGWGGTCATGTAQSPIDLVDGADRDLPDPLFAYQAAGTALANDGHTIRVDFPAGSTMEVDGQRWQLLQFHFHVPSEHTVGGRSFPAEVHLVHRNDAGQLAVVGVMLVPGESSPVAGLLASIPGHGTSAPLAKPFDPTALLPASRATWRYGGSLTTPPCSEGVRWMVMRDAVAVPASELRALAGAIPGSARPVQPRHDRELLRDSTP